VSADPPSATGSVAPVGGTTASPRYDEEAVRTWLRHNGKQVKDLSADRILWSAMDAWRGIASPEEMGSVASALIAWRYVSDPDSPGFDDSVPAVSWWPELRRAEANAELVDRIRDGMQAYEATYPQRGHLFGGFIDHTRNMRELETRPAALQKFIDVLSTLEASRIGGAFTAFQDFLTRSARRGYDELATSDTLVDLVAAVAGSVPGPVHDPAAGSGRLLLAVGSTGDSRTRLTGQDVSAEACAQANQRALVTGRPDVAVLIGDVFANDRFDRACAQVVVIDPPYGQSYQDADRLGMDPRLPYGPPPRSSLDTAWLQLALWYLGENGRAFVLQPRGSAFQGGPAGRVRAEMVKNATVEAVVALPANLASHTTIPLNLWVLARPGEVADPDRVLLIDYGKATRPDVRAIATALQEWREHRVIPESLAANAITTRQILDGGADLSPARWLTTTQHAPNLDDVRNEIEAVRRAVAQLKQLDKLGPTSLEAATEAPRMLDVSALSKSGALTVLKSTARIKESELSDKGTPVVTGTWIRGGDDTKWVNLSILGEDPVITRPGDVLVQNTGGLAARVDEEGGRVLLSPSFLLLRPRPDLVNPRYLAELIATKANAARAQGTAIQRIRIQDLKVPLLPLAEQARTVARIQEIRDLESAARGLLDGAIAARDSLVDAVAGGTLKIEEIA
jgi:hypothetical protein